MGSYVNCAIHILSHWWTQTSLLFSAWLRVLTSIKVKKKIYRCESVYRDSPLWPFYKKLPGLLLLAGVHWTFRADKLTTIELNSCPIRWRFPTTTVNSWMETGPTSEVDREFVIKFRDQNLANANDGLTWKKNICLIFFSIEILYHCCLAGVGLQAALCHTSSK